MYHRHLVCSGHWAATASIWFRDILFTSKHSPVLSKQLLPTSPLHPGPAVLPQSFRQRPMWHPSVIFHTVSHTLAVVFPKESPCLRLSPTVFSGMSPGPLNYLRQLLLLLPRSHREAVAEPGLTLGCLNAPTIYLTVSV